MKTLRTASIVFLLLVSATAVSALPQWWVNLFGLCDDGDNGPTKLDVPLPFIGMNSYARDKAGTQFDWCVDEQGNKKNTSDIVRERYCGKDKKVAFKDYNCLEYGLQKCVDTPRGAACVRKGPGPFCGDGRRDPGEQCDPPLGNCMTPAGVPGVCDFACKCKKFRCGDNIVDPNEDCDPPGGNCRTAAGQQGKCTADCKCKPGRCGNSVVEAGEQCDPPNAACRDADGFEGLCTGECSCSVTRRPTGCGNNRIDPGEDCDPPGRACRTLLGVGICSEGCKCRGTITEPPTPTVPTEMVELQLTGTRPVTITPTLGQILKPKTEQQPMLLAQRGTSPGTIESTQRFKADPKLWWLVIKKCEGAYVKRLAACRKYENYFFDFQSSVRDLETGAEDSFEKVMLNGPCPNEKPGDEVPMDIDSEFIDIQEKRYEIVCSIGCYGWACKKPAQPKQATRPQIPVVQPPAQEPTPTKSCDELCRERGLTTQQPDHSQYILSYVQQYQCVSGARITLKGTTTLSGPNIECKCYSSEPPQIAIDQTPPICTTPCGTIQCGTSTSCPCPDTPNCIATVSCTWSGWKMDQNRPTPVFGAQSAQQSSGDTSRMQ